MNKIIIDDAYIFAHWDDGIMQTYFLQFDLMNSYTENGKKYEDILDPFDHGKKLRLTLEIVNPDET